MHRLLSDQIVSLGLEGFYRITQTSITGANGTEFIFAGLRQQDVAKIKSFEGVDRAWVEEAQTVTKRSWEILIPTIRKPDSEVWVSFNPDLDTDETYLRYVVDPPQDAVIVNVNWHDNPWFPDVLRKEMEALRLRDPDAYENVWEGKCKSAVEGAIYLREIEAMHKAKRFCPVPHDPMLKVHTVWDLGWNDQMSIILVQRVASSLMVIDYIEDSHRTYADYIADLKAMGYEWGTDYLPHDAVAKDPQMGMSAAEIFKKLGRKTYIVPRGDIEQGIKAARMVFPRVYFDRDKALRLVNCLKRYRRAIPVTTNEPGAPLHDEYSHGADAFRYMALIADKMSNDEMKMKPIAYSNAGII